MLIIIGLLFLASILCYSFIKSREGHGVNDIECDIFAAGIGFLSLCFGGLLLAFYLGTLYK